jgi:hypothetical protein
MTNKTHHILTCENGYLKCRPARAHKKTVSSRPAARSAFGYGAPLLLVLAALAASFVNTL